MIDSNKGGRANPAVIGTLTRSVRDEIDALHTHAKIFTTIDPTYIRNHALDLLQLSCELLALNAQELEPFVKRSEAPTKAVTIHEAAGRPTSID